jgi:Cys-rich protein (TIGR01571 family)
VAEFVLNTHGLSQFKTVCNCCVAIAKILCAPAPCTMNTPFYPQGNQNKDWSSGFFDILSNDIEGCLRATYCPCFVYGDLEQAVQGQDSQTACCLAVLCPVFVACCAHPKLRRAIEAKYGLRPDEPCNAWCVSVFCLIPFALNQEMHQVFKSGAGAAVTPPVISATYIYVLFFAL